MDHVLICSSHSILCLGIVLRHPSQADTTSGHLTYIRYQQWHILAGLCVCRLHSHSATNCLPICCAFRDRLRQGLGSQCKSCSSAALYWRDKHCATHSQVQTQTLLPILLLTCTLVLHRRHAASVCVATKDMTCLLSRLS